MGGFNLRRIAICVRPAPLPARRVRPSRAAPLGFASIDRRRVALDWSLGRLAAAAGVSVKTLERASVGRPLLPSTLNKLDAALDGVAPQRAPRDVRARLIRTCYRAFVGALAPLMDVAADAVLAADPRTADRSAAALALAHCRQRAFYLTVTELDLGVSEVARVVRVTKQAVSKVLRAVEDERERPDIDALLDRAAFAVMGAQ